MSTTMNVENINGLGSCQPASNVADKRAIVAAVVGPVDWDSDTSGFITCPGASAHTSPDGDHDCKLFLDRVPTIHCMHASCSDEIIAKNKQLRVALRDNPNQDDGKQPRLTDEQKRRIGEAARRHAVRRQASSSRDRLLRDYVWRYDEIIAASPVALSGNEKEHGKLLLQRFKSDDVIWIGNKRDSGQEYNAANFRSKDAWLGAPWIHDQFICPVAFKPGSISRGNEQILQRRFLVVESDELSKDEVGAIFKWLASAVGLDLVAIVDTAGKSLHGWFTFPPKELLEELKLILPALGCDPKLFTPSQPVRFPGAVREGKYQKLIYLKGEVAQ